jgi:hypothetical protein
MEYIYNGIIFPLEKRKAILSFVATLVNLKNTVICETHPTQK